MSDDATFGMLTGRLHSAHGQSRRTRSDNCIRASRSIHVGEQFDLEILPFRAVLLHQVGVRERCLQIGCEFQAIARRVLGKADDGEVFPRGVDVAAQVGFGVGCRVCRGDIESTREVERCPARPDNACADNCYVANLLIVCHEKTPP